MANDSVVIYDFSPGLSKLLLTVASAWILDPVLLSFCLRHLFKNQVVKVYGVPGNIGSWLSEWVQEFELGAYSTSCVISISRLDLWLN